MIYKKMCSRLQRLEQEITAIQHQLEMMPQGKLVCTTPVPIPSGIRATEKYLLIFPKRIKNWQKD